MADIAAGEIEQAKGGAAGHGGALAVLPPLTFLQKNVYSTADFAEAVVSIALGQFLLFYLTAVVGISGSLAGTILALTLVVDAIVDPAVGYVSDNIRSRFGRRHPFMFAAMVPLAVSLAMIFSVPHFDSAGATFAYVFVVLLLLRFSYSVYILPYIALGAELSRDYEERSVLQVYRNLFNIAGNILTVNIGLGLFMSGPRGLLTHASYIPFGWTCAAIVLVMCAICAFGTLQIRHRLYEVEKPERSALQRLPGELKDVFRNHSFIMLLLTIVIFWIAQGSSINLSVYTFTYFWRIDANTIRIVLTCGTFGYLAGVPVCAALLRRFEKKDICTAAIVIVCVLLFLPPVLRIAHLLPESGWWLNAILSGFAFVQSVVLTSVFISYNSMMVDATDEHALLFGVRREGLYFAAISFSGKAALGVGSLFAGVALDYIIQFPRDIAAHPGMVIPDWTLVKLGLISGPGAAAISAVSAISMSRYRISKQELLRIQSELAKR